MVESSLSADQHVNADQTTDEKAGVTVKGETFFAIFKDGLYVLFALFFGALFWGYNNVYPRTDARVLSGGGTIDVTLDEFSINGDLVAGAGDVTLNVVNVGTVTHNVVARDLGVQSLDLGIGGTNVVELGVLDPGTYELFCSITGHEESGMVADLTIVEPSS